MSELRPLRVAVFSTNPHDIDALTKANLEAGHELCFHDSALDPVTAQLAADSDVVCASVQDDLGTRAVERLALAGIGLIAMRCAGVNNVDLAAAKEHDISVVRVDGDSPNAVAEQTIGLVLSLNRRIHRAHDRVKDKNFSLDGLLGFDLFGTTVGVVGTGRIGTRFAQICVGTGMRVLAADPVPNLGCEEAGVRYVALDELFSQSDIVSLHCPLTAETHHLVDERRLSTMKDGVMVINTSRSGLLDIRAVIDALKSGKLGYLGLDLYEQENGLSAGEFSDSAITDDALARLLTFPNVLITRNHGLFTRETLAATAKTTIESISSYAADAPLEHEVQLADFE